MDALESVEVSADLISDLRAASERANDWLKIAKALRTQIEECMGETEVATVDGEPVIRWAHVKSRRLDTDALRAHVDPAVLASCYVESVERRFIKLSRQKADT